MIVGFSQVRQQPETCCLDSATPQRHQPSALIDQAQDNARGCKSVGTAPPCFKGKDVRSWVAQISCYYDSLGFVEEEMLEDVPAFLKVKALDYLWSIEENAPKLRLRGWSDFVGMMVARFSG